MAKHSGKHKDGTFNCWITQDQAYISIQRYVPCRHSLYVSSNHQDKCQYLFIAKTGFFLKTQLNIISTQSIKNFIVQWLYLFDFGDPNNVKFDKKPANQVQLMKEHHFCPSDSLYQAIMATYVIEIIRLNESLDLESKIQRYWSQYDFNQMSQMSRRSAKRAISIFKGMFQFQQGLYNSESKYYMNSNVFSQQRLIDGILEQSLDKDKNWIVYHPTSITRQIFNMATKENLEKLRGKGMHLYIHGQGGLGKSTSFSLLVGLHNFIDNFRQNYQKDLEMSPYESNQNLRFSAFPKYFYFNLQNKSMDIQQLIASLIEQLPTKLKIIAIGTQISKLTNLFNLYNKQYCVLIIDQINILFSSLRRIELKKSKQQTKQSQEIADSICKMLNNLPNTLRLIYGSPQNAELTLTDSLGQIFRNYILKFQKAKVHRLFKRLDKRIISEIVSIIQFQNINRVIKRKISLFNQIVLLKRKEFSFIKQVLSNWDQDEIPLYLQQFTHERVKQYFLNVEDHQKNRIVFGSDISGFFKLIEQMYSFMVKQFSLKYRQFIKYKVYSQNDRFRKYRFLTRIRIAAFYFKRNKIGNQPFFQYKIDKKQNFQIEQVFKDHLEVDSEKLTIFLSPIAFIQATMFMEDQESLLLVFLKTFIKEYCEQPDWFGKTMQTTIINLMYGQKVFLRLQGIVQEEVGLANIEFKFGHYLRMLTQNEKNLNKIQQDIWITPQNSISKCFNELCETMDQSGVPTNYFICAKPCLMTNGLPQLHTNSSNSQAIDLLLIKRLHENRTKFCGIQSTQIKLQDYELITFDFCMSFNKAYTQQKYDNAILSITKLGRIADIERQQMPREGEGELHNHFTRYKKIMFHKITHVIVLPTVMISQVEIQLQQSQFWTVKLFPVEKMKIQILQAGFQKEQNNDIRKQIFFALINAVENRLKV